ncbi:unnamed protein product, partial [Ilex paraguariensis]
GHFLHIQKLSDGFYKPHMPNMWSSSVLPSDEPDYRLVHYPASSTSQQSSFLQSAATTITPSRLDEPALEIPPQLQQLLAQPSSPSATTPDLGNQSPIEAHSPLLMPTDHVGPSASSLSLSSAPSSANSLQDTLYIDLPLDAPPLNSEPTQSLDTHSTTNIHLMLAREKARDQQTLLAQLDPTEPKTTKIALQRPHG